MRRWIVLFLLFTSERAFCQDALVPETRLRECSDSAIDFAMRASQVRLDYTPASLRYVDGFMNDLHTLHATSAKVGGHIRVMGCYAGEVFVRNLNGKWLYPSAELVAKLGPGPFVQLPSGVLVNPLDKVKRIYQEGLTHSVYKFFLLAEAMNRAPAETKP